VKFLSNEDVEAIVAERITELTQQNQQLQQQLLESRRAEHILRENERLFLETQKLAKLGSWEFNPFTQQIKWSEEACKIIGINSHDLPPPSLNEYLDLVHLEDVPLLLNCLKQAVTEGVAYEIEIHHRYPDGSYNDTLMKAQPFFAGQRVIKLLGIMLDITERRQTEDELRKLSRAIEQSAGTIFITNVRGQIEFVNPAFSEITGYSSEEVIGNNPNMLNSGKNPPEVFKVLWETLHRGEVWQGELLNRRKNGELYWEFTRISPVKNKEGKVTHYVATKEDITRRKQAEAQLEKNNAELRAKNVELEVLNQKLADIQKAKLYQLNKAYERFVPHQFLSLLGKKSILEVQLGDQVEKEMTILFSDIRGFATISEDMTPQENFDFINAYLGQMEPIINEYGGFIDKYIGDAIMALFPLADDAVQSSIAMLKRLREYNQLLQMAGFHPIKIGIGLHTGPLMLGTVGGQNRMDGTVIADAVNLASRVENLTKIYNTPLLMTMQTYRHLLRSSHYKIRVIDTVKIKGKSKEVTVYEVFDADTPATIELKLETLKVFKQGLDFYHCDDFKDACSSFEEVLRINEHDEVARIYLKRCQE